MKINPQYNNIYPHTSTKQNTNFGSAKDINLRYIYKKRLHLLPERMKEVITEMVESNMDTPETLRSLHLAVYNKLLECQTLEEARNIFPEFREVLNLDSVVRKGSNNLRKIKEKMPLGEFSLFMLKERWGRLKTLNEIAQDLGLKNRSALAWFNEKARIPDLGKNYQTLLKASDEELNAQIAAKTLSYNSLHYESVVTRNRLLGQKNRALNSYISKEAWKRLPEARDALSEISAHTKGEERFAVFWAKYPYFAEKYGQLKREVAEEIRQSKK